MSVVKRISLLCALLCAAGAAHAISLGAIELESALNQPLQATVPLRGVASDELSGLRVRLAPAERFEAAGLIRDDYLRNLRLSVEEGRDGRPVVRIRGEGPLREPMLDLLIELRQGRQNVQRGYTLLVDPPEMAREPSAAVPEPAETRPEPKSEPAPEPEPEFEGAPESRPAAERVGADAQDATTPMAREGDGQEASPAFTEDGSAAEPEQSAKQSPRFFEEREPASERQLDPELLAEIEAGRDRPQPRAARASTQALPARSAEDGVYVVRAGETLWRVAYNTRGASGEVTMAQQMLAIVIANPEAFDEGDATALLRGSRLRIPPPDAVRRIDAAEADRTMAALTAGDRRTDAVNPDLMRTEDGPESDAAQTSTTMDDADAAESQPEADDADDGGGKGTVVTEESEAQADAAPDAAALLVDRELTRAQQRAAEAEASEQTEVEPVPEQAQSDDAEPKADTEQAPDRSGDDAAAVAEGGAQPAEPPSPAPAGESEGGFDLRLLGAVAVVVLLLVALLVWRRRRAEAEVFANDDEEASDLVPASFETSDDVAAVNGDDASDPSEAPSDAGSTEPPEPRGTTGEGDDPMADADFRIAYGMFDDAEARLQEAIRREPERADLRLKLAEVHHASEQREAFLEAADAASGCGLDEEQRGELARMADRIAPDSRHASGLAAGAAIGATLNAESEDPATAEPAASEPTPAEGVPGEVTAPPEQGLDVDLAGLDTETGGTLDESDSAGEGGLDFDLDQLDDLQSDDVKDSVAPALDEGSADNLLDFDLNALETGDSDSPKVAEEPATRTDDENSLDFDLDALDFDADDSATADSGAASSFDEESALDLTENEVDAGAEEPAAQPAAEPESDAPDLDLDDFSLADFDVSGDDEGAESEPAAEPMAAPAQDPAAGGGDEDFAIGGLDLEPEGEPDADDAGAMAGQLDMARAYVDLGDVELARPMLQEVAERGDAEQQREAAELLDKLG